MPEGLLITIGADGSQLTKTLADLDRQLKNFQKGLKDASNIESFGRINRAIAETKQRIDALKNFTGPTSGLKGLSGSSNQAAFALQNLSRVAQDAPYGFIGIANNLNPLLESFQRLRASTGTTGGALRALASSLTGAGGIGLALGVVSSLLVVFGDKLFGSKRAAEDNKKALDDLNLTIEAATKNISDLSAAVTQANQIAKLEIEIELGPGVTATTRSLNFARIQIDQQLESIRKDIETLTKAASDAFSLNFDKGTEETKSQLDKANKALEDAQNKEKELFENRRVIYKQIELEHINDQRETAKKQSEERKRISEKRLAELRAEHEKELVFFRKIREDTIKFLEDLTPIKTQSIAAIRLEINPNDIEDQVRAAIEKLSGAGLGGKLQLPPLDIPKVPTGILKELNEDALETADTISNVLAPAFGNLFDAIIAGESPLKAFFDSILQSISQVIQKLIAAAIQAAVLSIILPGGGGGFGKLFGQALGVGGRANMGNIGGGLAMNVMVQGNTRIAGNDLLLSFNRTIATQGRTG